MKRTLDLGPVSPVAAFEDLPIEVLSTVAKLSLSPCWIKDERANLRQLLDYSLVSPSFRDGVSQARRDPDLIGFRSRAARKDYVQWGHKPEMHDRLVEKWGVKAVPGKYFGDFSPLQGLSAQQVEAIKKANRWVDPGTGTVYLGRIQLDVNEFADLLDSMGNGSVTRLILNECIIVPKSTKEYPGEFTKMQVTLLALDEVRDRLADLQELHFTFSDEEVLTDAFFLSGWHAQLENAISRFFGNLKKLECFNLKDRSHTWLTKKLIISELPISLKKLKLSCVDFISECGAAALDYVPSTLHRLINLEELYVYMDIGTISESLGKLIGCEDCKLKFLHIITPSDDWYDVSPLFNGLGRNCSLEHFYFDLNIECDWDFEFDDMLGNGGPELLEKWLANHPALFDVHLEMLLSEKEYRSLIKGAKRSISLRKLHIYPQFDKAIKAFQPYALTLQMLDLANSNPGIISLEWDRYRKEVNDQLAANSRISDD